MLVSNANDKTTALAQFKNYSLKLLENIDGINSVATYSSFILPMTLHAGLYYEAEQFINFTNYYLDLDDQI